MQQETQVFLFWP